MEKLCFSGASMVFWMYEIDTVFGGMWDGDGVGVFGYR